MNPVIEINERVDVVTIFYSKANERLLCVPKKMKYKGREIDFISLALRHQTQKGRRMIHVFDVSDGVNDYRLEFDAEHLTWTLISMIGN
jgi:hypothetical protein